MAKSDLEDNLREHIPYEWAMMQQCGQQIDANGDAFHRNVMIECFCLHARNLRMFLVNDQGPGNKNVTANMFVPDFERNVPDKLWGAFQRLNAQTTHLGKQRHIDQDSKFGTASAKDISEWIVVKMQEFVAALNADQRAVWGKPKRSKLNSKVVGTSSYIDLSTAGIPLLNKASDPSKGEM